MVKLFEIPNSKMITGAVMVGYPQYRYPTHFFNEDESIIVAGITTPLVSRLNISKIFVSALRPLILEYLRQYNDVTIEEFYK